MFPAFPSSWRARITMVNALRLLWVVVVWYFERGIFFSHAGSCSWPQPPTALDILGSNVTHVLLVADPQILNHRSYPGRPQLLTWLTQKVVDLNIRKNWQAAMSKKPDAVIFLGDMMDGGRFAMSEDEYQEYHARFSRIFELRSSIPSYFIPGNHDTGLGVSTDFSVHARARYVKHFGPLNKKISMAGHDLILIDAPALVEEDRQRTARGTSLARWDPLPDETLEFIDSLKHDNNTEHRVLFTHIPLSRPFSAGCGPLRERGTIRAGTGFGYQNTLSEQISAHILTIVNPLIIFSGDDHDYCEYNHWRPGGSSSVREVTVKSLSMAMGIKQPGFHLLSLDPAGAYQEPPSVGSLAEVPCFLPDQVWIYLSVYVPLLLVTLVLLAVSHFYDRPASSIRNGKPEFISSLPSPVSAEHTLRRSQSYTFTVMGRRRRIVLPGWHTVWSQRLPNNQRRGLGAKIMVDVRDTAMYPLSLFVILTWWTIA
ncbi:Metallo-dependent phosphatase [Fistulina hepatica ATCC 64428]|uniref:Metallo-dependent phosphatase n=1 Tax=Fistulina hepatica ATCC 64428 TaxID=1128425 RepID=A0A0D7ADW9_9AGAR|nr:Metallo-dependent phosphatase [Fistulina hepatica ATCC 64428]